ncbi:hypothetical protein SCUP234_10938 [Seiridium cupressi]
MRFTALLALALSVMAAASPVAEPEATEKRASCFSECVANGGIYNFKVTQKYFDSPNTGAGPFHIAEVAGSSSTVFRS